jgi:hypothetical protein
VFLLDYACALDHADNVCVKYERISPIQLYVKNSFKLIQFRRMFTIRQVHHETVAACTYITRRDNVCA